MNLTKQTIKGLLKKKVEMWLSSIDDEQLRNDISGKVLVTGGCIVSMLLDEKVNDYDVYLKDKDSVVRLAKYYLKRFADNPPPKFAGGGKVDMYVRHDETDVNGRVDIYIKSAGIAGEAGDGDTYTYFETQPPEEAVEYVDLVIPDENESVEDRVNRGIASMPDDLQHALVTNVLDAEDAGGVDESSPEYVAMAKDAHKAVDAPIDTKKGAKNAYRPVFLSSNAITLSDSIQLCIRFYGEVDEVHKNFDFDHCKCFYDHGSGVLTIPDYAATAILTKELRYSGSLYPMCSIIRTRKFTKRGWSCNAGQYVAMMDQVNKLDLSDIDVWEQQLTGVDAAYFAEIIKILKNAKARGELVDQAYVIALINKMF